MRITNVEGIVVSIPIRKTTTRANKTVKSREYVITRVRTNEGVTAQDARQAAVSY